MLTTREGRKRAAAKAIFDKELLARIDRERNTPSDEQRRKALMQSCIAEAEAEQNAAREKELAPVRQLEKKLNASREVAARQARYDLSVPDYKYFLEICPPYVDSEDYLEKVSRTFQEFRQRLESTGVTITDDGIRALAALSEDNRALDWSSATTFSNVFEHCVTVQFLKENRDYLVERDKHSEPAPVKQAPDFDTLLATRSADDPELRNAAHEFAIEEARPTFNEWVDSLLVSFGYSMPLPVAKQVSDWFIQTNHSFLDRSAYDQCRRAFVREGIMPRTCLTPDDLAAEEMESLDIRTPEGRRRAAQLHREGIRRAEASQNQFQS
jgi:hypothetical protein